MSDVAFMTIDVLLIVVIWALASNKAIKFIALNSNKAKTILLGGVWYEFVNVIVVLVELVKNGVFNLHVSV